MNYVTLICLLAIAAMVVPARAQQAATSSSESTGPRIHVPLADGWRLRRTPRAAHCLTFSDAYDLCDRHGGLLSLHA